MFMRDCEQRVVDVMLFEDIIPSSGIFQITEKQLQSYIDIYGNIFGKAQGVKTKSNYRYARKLAGLTLLKVNFHRGAKFNDIQAGCVYIIENPAFLEHYKIGMTLDVIDRLSQYQTYDPLKRFRITKYDFVMNRHHAETRLLSHPDMFTEQGEWVKRENAINLFEKLIFIPQ